MSKIRSPSTGSWGSKLHTRRSTATRRFEAGRRSSRFRQYPPGSRFDGSDSCVIHPLAPRSFCTPSDSKNYTRRSKLPDMIPARSNFSHGEISTLGSRTTMATTFVWVKVVQFLSRINGRFRSHGPCPVQFDDFTCGNSRLTTLGLLKGETEWCLKLLNCWFISSPSSANF